MQPNYDDIAPRYDAAFRPFEKWFVGSMRSETLAQMPVDSAILEVGAGTGANFKYYPHFRRAVASELSTGMLDFARRKTETIDLVQADAQSLPFDANLFDAAFATLVFCSIPDPHLAFTEIIRVVKPRGTVVLLEHVRPPGPLGYLFDLMNVMTAALIDDHFNRRTADIARDAGLRVVEVRKKLLGIVNLILCEVDK